MVVLNRIYTRTGDQGDTALGNGARVPKDDLRVESYGTVDETNAAVGLARLHAGGAEGPPARPSTGAKASALRPALPDVAADSPH